MLENITLSRKLMGSFLVVAFITLGIGVVGFWGVSVLGKHLTEVGSVRLPSIESLRAMESETRQIVIPALYQVRGGNDKAGVSFKPRLASSYLYARLPK